MTSKTTKVVNPVLDNADLVADSKPATKLVGEPNVSNPAESRTQSQAEEQTKIGSTNGTADESPPPDEVIPTASSTIAAKLATMRQEMERLESQEKIATVSDLVVGLLNFVTTGEYTSFDDMTAMIDELQTLLQDCKTNFRVDVFRNVDKSRWQYGIPVALGATKSQPSSRNTLANAQPDSREPKSWFTSITMPGSAARDAPMRGDQSNDIPKLSEIVGFSLAGMSTAAKRKKLDAASITYEIGTVS